MGKAYTMGMLWLCASVTHAQTKLPLPLKTAVYYELFKTSLKTDEEAYTYCQHNPKSFIAIVWPIANGKNHEIKKIFKHFGAVVYKKKVQLNFKSAYHLLQEAHPFIKDMHEHVNWYFPKDTIEKPARIFVVEFENTATAVACKMAIRGLFNLQYRAIHINDTHEETMSLAKFFFS